MFLQHATGVKPYVIGKPSSAYFKAALKELGVAPDMVCYCGLFQNGFWTL